MKYMEIHEILRFKPSATLHETFVFLRKKQGLRSSTPQEPQKTWKSSKIPKVHEISWNFGTTREKPEISKNFMVLGVREWFGAPQPLKKHWNYLCFCMPALYGGFLVNSIIFRENHENPWKWRNSGIFWKSRLRALPHPQKVLKYDNNYNRFLHVGPMGRMFY